MYSETTPRLDFSIIDTHNPLTIGIADTSFYPANFTVTNPSYEIYPPSFPKVVVEYTKSGIAYLNSNNLNITCVDDARYLMELPDGIWTIKQSISPVLENVIERSFLRTTQIEQRFGKAFLQTDITQCDRDVKDQQMDVLNQIHFYIQGAIAAGNQCNDLLAMKLYRSADRMLIHFFKQHC